MLTPTRHRVFDIRAAFGLSNSVKYGGLMLAEQHKKATDSELLDAPNDPAAFLTVADRHVEAIFRFALEALGHEEDAQDVLQDVLEIAYRRRRSINTVDGSARLWLLTTCRNVLSNRMKSAEARRTVTSEAVASTDALNQDSDFERVDSRRMIDRISKEMGSMNSTDHQVFAALMQDHMTYYQVAARFGISIASVKKRVHRVRRKLRHRFGGEL